MKTLYGILLLTLFTINATQERPTLFGRTRQFTVRLKEKCLRTIKKQYQDKYKRRMWLSSGVIGAVTLLSLHLNLWNKLLRQKKEETGSENSNSRPTQAEKKRREEETIANLSGKYDVAEEDSSNNARFDDPLPSSSSSYENRTGTMVKKSEEELAQEKQKSLDAAEQITKKLREQYGMHNISRTKSAEPEQEEEENESASGTFIDRPDKQECQPNPLLERQPESNRPSTFGQAGAIESHIERFKVIPELRKLKRETKNISEAKKIMKKKLCKKHKLSDIIANKVIDQAVQQIKQNQQLRNAIKQGDWDTTVGLLPTSTTTKKRAKINALFKTIEQRGTLSEKELRDLGLILWKLIYKDETPIKKEFFDGISRRKHSDRATILGMLPDPSASPT